ncbi:SCO family protein [Pelagibius sp. Alg239-R121]|uniref:SCO family protein n=1 Tax=Pelagibius sp. Alg239-R121 TaxID=2993448 RepID=UPI0024A70E9E|nr:SCO family protein [Pelagibius sp. Alg239-R121]
MSAQSSIYRWFPSLGVLVLGVGTLWAATDGFRALTEESARRLQVAESRPQVPSLLLEDMNGRILGLTHGAFADKAGEERQITLVEFIYTSCPTICQTAGSDYAQLRDRLKQSGLGDRVRLLSVSFDPEQDGPEELRGYAEAHGADGVLWNIARVGVQDLELMKRSFGLRVIPDVWGGYEHNAAMHLIDPSGRFSAVFDIDDVEGAYRALEERL